MPPRALVLTLSIFLASASCTDGPANDVEGSQQASVTHSTGAEPERSTPDDHEAERQAKLAHREPGETEVRSIDWSDAASHQRADTSTLSTDARAAIEAATLPVLLPRDSSLTSGAVITRGPTWYAASLHPEGHHITLNGRKAVTHQPTLAVDVPEDQRRRPGEISLSRTHGIVNVAFDAFGASYTMNVECEAPTTDVRCTEDAYARALVDDLGVAGGTP